MLLFVNLFILTHENVIVFTVLFGKQFWVEIDSMFSPSGNCDPLCNTIKNAYNTINNQIQNPPAPGSRQCPVVEIESKMSQ